jgi:hypothetical protein
MQRQTPAGQNAQGWDAKAVTFKTPHAASNAGRMGVPAHAGGSAGRGLTLHPGRPSGVLTKDVDMKPLRKPIRSQAAPSSPQDAAALAASTMAALGDILIAGGQCDARALDRSRRVAAETGDRLDSVLVQLGLVS